MRWGLSAAGLVHGARGEYDEGRTLYEASLELSPHGDPYRTQLTHNLGELELAAGNLGRGRSLLVESLEEARLREDIGTQANVTHGLGDAALLADELDTAAAYYADAANLARTYDSLNILWACLGGLSAVAAAGGQTARASTLWGAFQGVEARSALGRDPALIARYERYLPILDETARAEGRGLDESAAWALAVAGGPPT